jgi:hypothetical protein
MEFRLLYQGELPSSGNKSKPHESHAIRRLFHPQLRSLWSVEENLRQLSMSRATLYKDDPRPMSERAVPKNQDEAFDFGLKAMGLNWNRAGFQCVPLVTEDMVLRCSLDVLLLRPEIEPRFILRRGDIDGQIKTLFDALRLPDNSAETGGMGPQEDETPFFVLLEDDRLITEVRVITDRLLLLQGEKKVEPNDSFVVVHVRLNHKNARMFDNWFG